MHHVRWVKAITLKALSGQYGVATLEMRCAEFKMRYA